MKIKQKLTVVLFAAVFAFGTGQMAMAQSGGMGGHGAGMAQEDPVPFVRDMDKAAGDILSQVKAGRSMDARNSFTRLSTAADKVLPHITDAALKDNLQKAVAEIKTLINSGSPDLFDLEDAIEVLQTNTKKAMGALQKMK